MDANQVLNKFEPIASQAIRQSFEKKLDDLGYEGVFIEDVEFDIDGYISIVFSDSEDDFMEVLFIYDKEYGPIAVVPSDDESDSEDLEDFIIELGTLNPTIKKTPLGDYIDLSNLDWLTSSLINTMFSLGDIDSLEEVPDDAELQTHKPNLRGYGFYGESLELEAFDLEIDERMIAVIRGGKKVRLPVVRKIRRKILTGKQKSAIRKAVRKRKVKQAKINRKRKKSLRVRKRMSIKKPKLSKFQKVAGTKNRSK